MKLCQQDFYYKVTKIDRHPKPLVYLHKKVQVCVFKGTWVGSIGIIVSWTVYTALVSDIFYNTEGAARHGKY